MLKKKKAGRRRVKSPTVRSLTKKLDSLFSKFIRLRDADETGTISCCTCGRLLHWRDSHACHFIRRQHMSVRWDERNVHAGCPKCNVFQGGNLDEYAHFIIERYGYSVFQELIAAKSSIKKWSRAELEEKILSYAQRVQYVEQAKSGLCE